MNATLPDFKGTFGPFAFSNSPFIPQIDDESISGLESGLNGTQLSCEHLSEKTVWRRTSIPVNSMNWSRDLAMPNPK